MQGWLIAQGVLDGAAGWSSFGIAGLVLAWLLLKHLPEKDKQQSDLLKDHRQEMRDKDDRIEKLVGRHAEAVKAVVEQCKEQSEKDREAGDRRHDEEMAALADLNRSDRDVVHAIRHLSQQIGLKQTLADALQSAEAPVWTKSLDGTLLSWNAAAERVLGWRQGEVVGQSIYRRVVPTDRVGEEEDILARIGRGETVPEYRTERRHRNGRLVPVIAMTSPIRDQAGKVIGASTIARTVEEQ